MERSPSYYAVLGVRPDASASEIRSAYRKLAMKWHPDRWRRQPLWVAEEAKRRFQLSLEAYQVLSDGKKRALYDVGLYDPFGGEDEEEEEEEEGFSEFVQEMLGLMANVHREGKDYSLEELQHMLAEIAQGFTSPHPQLNATQCFHRGTREGARSSKRFRCDAGFTPANVSVFGVGSH